MIGTNSETNNSKIPNIPNNNSYSFNDSYSINNRWEYQRRLLILLLANVNKNGCFKYPPFKEKISSSPPDNPQELYSKIIGLVKEKSQITGNFEYPEWKMWVQTQVKKISK